MLDVVDRKFGTMLRFLLAMMLSVIEGPGERPGERHEYGRLLRAGVVTVFAQNRARPPRIEDGWFWRSGA